MSFIGDIVQKILHPHGAQAQPPPSLQANPPSAQASQPTSSPVNVEKVLSDMAAKHSEKLNWRTSIVDLLKVLNLDSSLKSRQQLAKELSYTGDTNDSATMNIWLHEKVMDKIAENGGQVPADLRKH